MPARAVDPDAVEFVLEQLPGTAAWIHEERVEARTRLNVIRVSCYLELL